MSFRLSHNIAMTASNIRSSNNCCSWQVDRLGNGKMGDWECHWMCKCGGCGCGSPEIFAYATSVSSFRIEQVQMWAAPATASRLATSMLMWFIMFFLSVWLSVLALTSPIPTLQAPKAVALAERRNEISENVKTQNTTDERGE